VSESLSETSEGLLRNTATITVWNAVSRITGFVRVLAVGAALGTTFLGNTYQSSNLVSNILFELLAAGLLAAPLVPAFVGLLDKGDRSGASQLGGTLLSLALAGLGIITAAGVIAAPWIMRALTSTVSDPVVRRSEVRLGTFLLWFFLPQLLLYAVGAVTSALLNAERRFAAVASAPVANNIVVTLTMIVFVAVRHGAAPRLPLPFGPKLVLAVGTTAGVLAMTSVPVVAMLTGGLRLRPRWHLRDPNLRSVARVGAWGAVFLAANQILIAVTLVLANRVAGGVVAYQIAFTFFLLPHALLAHPIFTALYPRLSSDVHAGRWDNFGRDVGEGVRLTTFLILPASALLAALGGPALRLVRLGRLDTAGVDLVARVLAAYALGLTGYAVLLLLVRAATAADDTKLAAVVGLGVTVVGAVLMVVFVSLSSGEDRVVALGLAHSVAMLGGAITLLVALARKRRLVLRVGPTVARSALVAAVGGGLAWWTTRAIGSGGRGHAATALMAGGVLGLLVVAGGHWALRSPELRDLRR
jgi:putative peptidoglycan lipid II flippase